MSNTIVFIHGMFLNPKCWEKWEQFFKTRGFDCVAPAWPLHTGEPAALRQNIPAGLGELDLKTITEAMRTVVRQYDNPILIGHSLGGLIVQILVNEGLASVGVPICSVAPNKMMSLDWGLLRNVLEITNPLKGNDPVPMDADGFFQNFGNTMPREASDVAFEQYATHESRNVLRDIMTDAGKIDIDRAHVPLLFISAEKDEIIPTELCEKNAKAYPEESGQTEFKEFKKRGHFICGQQGWEEVADYIDAWLEGRLPDVSAIRSNRREALRASQ